MLRNYWLSLSFANLVYLRAWADLLPGDPDNLFFRKTMPGFSVYFAITADVFILSLLTFLVICLAPRLPRRLQALLAIVGVAMVAMAARSVAPERMRSGLWIAAVAGLIALLAGLAIWLPSRIIGIIRAAALAATPCLAVTLVGSLYYLSAQTPLPPDPALAPRLAGGPPVRVLWILFDDWDEGLTFSNRAAGVRLPAIDVLANRSFMATRALAVQAGRMNLYDMYTYGAVPALLYGKFLKSEKVEDAKTMRLDLVSQTGAPFDDGKITDLGAPGNVFDRARARGWNTAAAGWYMPYCRVFGPQLTDCYWDVRYVQAYSVRADFVHAAIDETRMLFETSAFSPFGPALQDLRHFDEYKALLAAGRRFAADPSTGIALIHFNVPHTPYFYDPKIGRSLRYGVQGALYTEALEYVDRAVGDILASVHGAGLDDKTAIILSSDHPFRFSGTGDAHVPFIVHLPGGDSGVVWSQEFSAIVTADLALAIAGGEVKSSAEVAEFVRKAQR